MLKKLAKYGNSTTLVIDKAILELLNMDESSIVKLHTDGKSLIITPMVNAEKEKISASPEEITRSAMDNMRNIQVKNLQNSSEEIKAKVANPNPEMERELKEHFARHMKTMQEITKGMESNEEYAEALKALEQKFDPKTHSAEYTEEFLKIRIQFFPGFAEIDKELIAIMEKYK